MGRYVSSDVVGWRIFSFLIHERHPTVGHLAVHLESVLVLSPLIHDLRPRNIYTSLAVTPGPDRVPIQRPSVPSFASVVGQTEKFLPCLRSWGQTH